MVKSIMIVGLGGFIGTVARFLISRYFQVNVASVFPWSTFVVNIVGCLLIGIIYGISEKGDFLSPEIRLFLTVGICGGFTTFSTFSNDAYMLIRQDEWFRFALYASLSFFLGLMAVYAGRFIIKLI
ncbi:MAG: fluoride efflux transporter CrcB [Bacteroidota bacterium]|nr:fluoride efflux transporter CrcB [Bacteroidota bacterium]MDO9614749.1 fluoride efflux transporter CrcB [Bacteroidota bacterium]MDP2114559.1 fluoride efflux transporter CrcB [Bacteroidota bacterium]MDP3432289.1 fluoride efflux transporter CrcB [Bacteroidota bacterium]